MILLIFVGGFAGSRFFEVEITFRRVTYLWWLAGAGLVLALSQMLWSAAPAAANAGLLPLLVAVAIGSFLVYGAAIYYGSAARANHIHGTTRGAWAGFIPFANLWLVFARGRVPDGADAPRRSAFGRFLLDPLLVLGALMTFAMADLVNKAVEEAPVTSASGNAALKDVFTASTSLEERLEIYAREMQRELPLQVDEVTLLREVLAKGDTLRLTYEVDHSVPGFRPEFRLSLASRACAPEYFARDLADGARIVHAYSWPSGRLVEEFELTQKDCNQAGS